LGFAFDQERDRFIELVLRSPVQGIEFLDRPART
jgi:hypothetical protein